MNDSQSTFDGVKLIYSAKDYHLLNKNDQKLLQQQRLSEFIQTSDSLKLIFIHSPDENDHEQQRLQTSRSVGSFFIHLSSKNDQEVLKQERLQTSHSFFIHSRRSPDKDDQEMLQKQSFIHKSHSDESVFIHLSNRGDQEMLQEQSSVRGSEGYLQRSEQISHNVSEIIDHENRYDCVITCDTNN